MPEFQKYPMVMTHPNARKGEAVPTQIDASGQKSRVTDYIGRPDFMPPVTVNNQDQEERHVAMGYLPAGQSNPTAYDQQANAPQPAGYEAHEYPKWIGDKLVNSIEEEQAITLAPTPAGTEVVVGGPMLFTGADGALYKFEGGQMIKVSSEPMKVESRILPPKENPDGTVAEQQAAIRHERALRAAATRKANKAKAAEATA